LQQIAEISTATGRAYLACGCAVSELSKWYVIFYHEYGEVVERKIGS
jgi:hypothetical protein